MGFWRLAARTVIGGLFIGHGTQKLKGWFDGPGLDGTEQMMKSLKMEPARENALLAGATETVGGGLLVAGLATPVASAALIGTMITAIRKVHLEKGPWNSGGGYEYNLVLIASLLELTASGPGKYSLDRALHTERTGFKPALIALLLGAAASTAAVQVGGWMAEADAPESPA